jgi:superfamily II DNA or RNA helicase
MITLYESATHLVVTGQQDEIDQLVADFQFRPEGYFYSPLYERFRVTQGKEGWDGYARPLQKLSSTAGRILRGRKQELLAVCGARGYKLDTRKLLVSPFSDLKLDDVTPDLIAGDFELDDNQRISIHRWLVSGIGVCRATVGAGKTATYAGAAALIKSRFPDACFLYMTPTERLVKQVTKEMKRFLPGWDIGQFGGGVKNLNAKDMVVCTVAMLNKHFHVLKGKKWFHRFIGLLYDEVHHCSSTSSQKIVVEVPAFFRLGASDTIKEDHLSRHNAILGHFGAILNEVTAAPLMEKGRLAKPHIYIVDVAAWNNKLRDVSYTPVQQSKAFVLLDGEWQKAKYLGPVYDMDDKGQYKMKKVKTAERAEDGSWITIEEPITIQGLHRIQIEGTEEEYEIESRWCLLDRMYDRCIIQYKPRNDLIVQWAKTYSDQKLPTLIVCTRTLHIYILEALLKAVIDPKLVGILFGQDSSSTRDEQFEWFRSTPGSVLITPLVKEGVSINEIQAGVIADYVSDWEVANQIIGRFLRKKMGPDNRAHITWFRDRQHPVLRRGCNNLFQQLEKIKGYTFYDPAPTPEEWLRLRQAE